MKAEKAYSVVRELGRGGMAKLFLAHSQLRREHVVLKQLTLTADEADRKRFIHEALISLKLTHPNIVRIYDVFESQGELFIEMEWIQGRSLEQLLRASQPAALPPGIACRVMYEVCVALHAAHHATDAQGRRLGVVHRDVKPSNVMVGLGGATKVIDFGIAWSSRTTIPAARGQWFTPGYLAPERALEMLRAVMPADLEEVGEALAPASPDGRSDQFCAGVILFELLTGRLPIPPPQDVGRSIPSQLTHCREVARCEVDVSMLPPELAAIVAKALARRPEDRYGTCQEMAHAIEQACALASQEQVALFLEQRFPEVKQEVEEAQQPPEAAAEVIRTLPLGASAGPAPSTESRAPAAPVPQEPVSGRTTPLPSQGAGAGTKPRTSLPSGVPPWALAGELNPGHVEEKVGGEEPPPRSSWRWALLVIAVLGVLGGWVLYQRKVPGLQGEQGQSAGTLPVAPAPAAPAAMPPEPRKPQEQWALEVPSTGQLLADGRTCAWLVAQVRDASGAPVQGRTVSLRVVSGVGELKPRGAQTDEQGRAQVCLTSAAVGPLTVAAFDGDSERVPARAVTFIKPPPTTARPLKLELGVTPGVVVADGGTEARVTATVTRGDGRPLKDRYLLLYADGGDVTPSTHRGFRVGPTDVHGQVTKAFTAKRAGRVSFSATLEARVGEQSVASLQDARVEFVAGRPDGKASTLTAEPVDPKAGARTELTLQLRDANQNPVRGARLSWGSPEAQASLVADTRTDEQGRATAAFTPRQRGSWKVLVSAAAPGDEWKVDLSALVRVEAGDPAETKSSLETEPPEALADGKSPITLRLHLRDAFGNPVQRQVELTVTDEAAGTHTTKRLETNEQGDATHVLTSDSAGTKLVSVEVVPGVRLRKQVAFRAPPLPVTEKVLEPTAPQAKASEDSTHPVEAAKPDAGPEAESTASALQAPPKEAAAAPDAGGEVAAPGPLSP